MEKCLALKFRFERIPTDEVPPPPTIQRFGELASEHIRTVPWLVAGSVFGRAERIAGGLLDPGLLAPQAQPNGAAKSIRLTSIEDSQGQIVEYKYDGLNRIDQVSILRTLADKFVWSGEGYLERVLDRFTHSTEFRRERSGHLSSIRYPDGALFKYAYDADGLLSSVVYPDDVEVRFTRDEHGRIFRSQCRDVMFQYGWDSIGQAVDLKCSCSDNSWESSLDRFNAKKKLEVVPKATRGNEFISCLGHWRYDSSWSLCEVFAPTGERFVVRPDPSGDSLSSWSRRGQVTYQFDKAGVLAAIQAWDGTHTMLKRNVSLGQVLLLSVAGVSVLNYDEKGRLVSERSQNGRSVSYGYAAGKVPVLVKCGDVALGLKWKSGRFLQKVSIPDTAAVEIKYRNEAPVRVEFRCGNCSMAQAVDAFIACFWDWQALVRARRFEDTLAIRGV